MGAKWLLFFLIFNIFFLSHCQKVKSLCVEFYNVENLFDTLDTYGKEDYEFLPTSQKKWNTQKYNKKLHHIARVIAALNDWKGADIIGLCEIENRKVLLDLVTQTYLNQLDYGIVHKESSDKRGIDVAFLYKKSKVTLLDISFIEVKQLDRPTRDVLFAKLLVGKDTLHYVVSHWPSRYGGEAVTDSKRAFVATKIRTLVDSIYQLDNTVKIIVVGDFNDNPEDESVLRKLGALADSSAFLFNTSIGLRENGAYTHKYQNGFSLFDQIVISNSLLLSRKGWSFVRSEIFKPNWLITKDNRFGGTKPFRTYMGKQYLGGYSDHFPVYAIFKIK